MQQQFLTVSTQNMFLFVWFYGFSFCLFVCFLLVVLFDGQTWWAGADDKILPRQLNRGP